MFFFIYFDLWQSLTSCQVAWLGSILWSCVSLPDSWVLPGSAGLFLQGLGNSFLEVGTVLNSSKVQLWAQITARHPSRLPFKVQVHLKLIIYNMLPRNVSTCLFSYLRCMLSLGLKLMGHLVSICFTFRVISTQFSRAVVPYHIPSAIYEGSKFFTYWSTLVIVF